MTTTDRGTLDFHELATREFDRQVRGVEPDDWSRPTPCPEWDVRTLMNHVIGETLWLPPIMDGRTIEEVGDRFDGDILGADPARTWTEAAVAAAAALREDGALGRTVHLSFGDLGADEYVWQMIADLTVHSWDLARGAGNNDRIDPELVDEVLHRFEPQSEMLAQSGMFGSPCEVDADAGPQTRMLALVGRRS